MDHTGQTTGPTADSRHWGRFVMIAAVAHFAIAMGIHWSDAVLRSLAPIQVGVALALGVIWVARARSGSMLGAACCVLAGAAIGAVVSILLHDQPWWFLLIGPPGQAVSAAVGVLAARPILDRLGIRTDARGS